MEEARWAPDFSAPPQLALSLFSASEHILNLRFGMKITSAAAPGSLARLGDATEDFSRPLARRLQTWATHARTLLSAAVLAVAVLAPGFTSAMGTRAEGPPQFDELVLTVLPEYDQPRVLVIMRGELPADTAMPLAVQFKVPSDANVTNTCSVKVATDEQVCTQATSQPDGEFKIVTYEVSTPVMYVEYYYGTFSGAGARSTDLQFWPPFPAAKLEIAVPAPTDATDFSASPAPTRTVDDKGAKHYIFNFQNVATDAPVDVTLSYSRPTDESWAPPSQPQQESGSTSVDPNDDGGLPQDAILFLALAAALAVAFIGYNAVGRRVRFDMGLTEASRPETAGGPSGRQPMIYCRSCGEPSRRPAGYCAACGRELRTASGNGP